MATYRVQAGDTPDSIAARCGYSGYAWQLIQANPQKPRQLLSSGQPTFRTLTVGELLALPQSWFRVPNMDVRGVGAFGLGDVNSDAAAVVALSPTDLCAAGNAAVMQFQTDWNAANPTLTQLTVDGKYGPATQTALQGVLTAGAGGTAPAVCTAYASGGTTYTQAQLVALANAVIADSSICSGVNANVSAFQTAYNSFTSSTLSVDGEYGPASFAAMNSVAAMAGVTLSGAIPAACPNFTPGSGTTTPPVTTSPTGTTTITNTTTTATSSAVPWVVGGLAVVAGVGMFYYLSKHHRPTATAAHPSLPAHRVARRR